MPTENTAEIKAITIEDLPARQIFENLDDCGKILKEYQAVAHDGVEFVVIGHDAATGEVDTGLYDPAIMRTMMYRLTRSRRVEIDGKPVTKKLTTAVIVQPFPRIDILVQTPEGLAYVEHLFETEAQHRSARPFREEESNLAAVAAEAPHTLAQFIEGTKKDSAGGLLAAFNEFFTNCNGQFKKKIDAYNRSKITKAELRQCLSCAGFAKHRFDHLEKVDFFVKMLNYFVRWASKNNVNPTLPQNWLKSRDAANFAVPTGEAVSNEMDDLLAEFGEDTIEEAAE